MQITKHDWVSTHGVPSLGYRRDLHLFRYFFLLMIYQI